LFANSVLDILFYRPLSDHRGGREAQPNATSEECFACSTTSCCMSPFSDYKRQSRTEENITYL